jgi:hypothetical protein
MASNNRRGQRLGSFPLTNAGVHFLSLALFSLNSFGQLTPPASNSGTFLYRCDDAQKSTFKSQIISSNSEETVAKITSSDGVIVRKRAPWQRFVPSTFLEQISAEGKVSQRLVEGTLKEIDITKPGKTYFGRIETTSSKSFKTDLVEVLVVGPTTYQTREKTTIQTIKVIETIKGPSPKISTRWWDPKTLHPVAFENTPPVGKKVLCERSL